MSAVESVAIGVGCRKDCPADAIARLVREAVARSGRGGAALFTIEDKRGEPGLEAAAARLGLRLVFLTRQTLAGCADRCETRSAFVRARFGLPSIAEAAALAGAGPGSRILVRRLSADGATCAVAGHAPDRGGDAA